MLRLALLLGLSWLLAGCGSAARPASPRVPNTIPIAPPAVYSPEAVPETRAKGGSILLTGPLAGAPTISQSRTTLSRMEGRIFAASAGERKPAPPPPVPIQAAAPRQELFDVEAHLTLEVHHVATGRASVVQLARAAGGQVVNEVIEDQSHSVGASLSLRVPSQRLTRFLADLAALGRVRSQKVESKEVGRKINDAEILLSNLQRALKRYEELLAKATNVEEATQIERELERVRTSIERVSGDLSWQRDRVERSTVYVTLAMPVEDRVREPEARLYPGLRGALLVDVPPEGSARSFGGGGLSLRWSRHFGMDLDLMTDLAEAEGSAIDYFVVTLGGELYSDFLGGGRRTWLNPYFGFRGGYARALGESRVPLGGALGVEIYKTRFVVLDLQTRVYGIVGADDGVHFGVQPALGVNVAY